MHGGAGNSMSADLAAEATARLADLHAIASNTVLSQLGVLLSRWM